MQNHSKYTVRKSVIKGGVAIVAIVVSLPTAVYAQDDVGVSQNTILVTARNRTESVQDVPLAISAFDQEAITSKNIQDLDDIARFTAGFSFEDFDGGAANPGIRGQSTLISTNREQTVAAFVDGIYLPRSYVVDLGTTAFERLEVVKGPQSARYGRNAFAGAINYISARPDNDLAVDVVGTIGTDDRYDLSGAVSLPIAEDILAVRLGYEHSEFDGSWENTHPNADAGFSPGTNGNIGGWNNDTFTAIAVFTPTDRVSIEASYMNFRKREEARAATVLNSEQGDTNCGAVNDAGFDRLFCGELPKPGETTVIEPRGFGRQADIDIFRVSAELDLSDSVTAFYQFGNITANTFSANTAESDPVGCGTILGPDRGFPVLCNFQGAPVGNLKYDQHELRFTFDNGGPLRAAVGGFYMNGDDTSIAISINLPPLLTTSIIPDTVNSAFPSNLIFQRNFTETKTLSFFAEATFAFNDDRTRLGVEGRYTADDIRTQDVRRSSLVGDETFKVFTPRVTVEHEVTDDSLLYATAARGAKAGGFNTNVLTPSLATFGPEFNWTYELGAKNTLMNGALIVNVAAFYTDWTSLQISNQDPVADPNDLNNIVPTAIANLGDATVLGFELEGSYEASDNLSFDTAISYTRARYADGTIDSQYTVGNLANGVPASCFDTPVCSEDGDIGGNTIQRSPEWQMALGGQWQDNVSDDLSYFVRADVAYQSSHFAESINVSTAPGRVVVNGRINFEYQDNINVSLWARNLLDERYISSASQIIQAGGANIIRSYLGERRTFGLTLGLSY